MGNYPNCLKCGVVLVSRGANTRYCLECKKEPSKKKIPSVLPCGHSYRIIFSLVGKRSCAGHANITSDGAIVKSFSAGPYMKWGVKIECQTCFSVRIYKSGNAPQWVKDMVGEIDEPI